MHPLLSVLGNCLWSPHMSTSLTGFTSGYKWTNSVHAGELGSGVEKNSTINPEVLPANESASSTSMAVIESFNHYSPSWSKTKFMCHLLYKTFHDTPRHFLTTSAMVPGCISHTPGIKWQLLIYMFFLSTRQWVPKDIVCVSFIPESLCWAQCLAQSRHFTYICVDFANILHFLPHADHWTRPSVRGILGRTSVPRSGSIALLLSCLAGLESHPFIWWKPQQASECSLLYGPNCLFSWRLLRDR